MSHVPMTHAGLTLAWEEHDMGSSSTLVDLPDGRILHFAGKRHRLSADGGLTWSTPESCTDQAGNPEGHAALTVKPALYGDE